MTIGNSNVQKEYQSMSPHVSSIIISIVMVYQLDKGMLFTSLNILIFYRLENEIYIYTFPEVINLNSPISVNVR